MSRVDELKQRLAVIKEAPKIKRVEVDWNDIMKRNLINDQVVLADRSQWLSKDGNIYSSKKHPAGHYDGVVEMIMNETKTKHPYESDLGKYITDMDYLGNEDTIEEQTSMLKINKRNFPKRNTPIPERGEPGSGDYSTLDRFMKESGSLRLVGTSNKGHLSIEGNTELSPQQVKFLRQHNQASGLTPEEGLYRHFDDQSPDKIALKQLGYRPRNAKLKQRLALVRKQNKPIGPLGPMKPNTQEYEMGYNDVPTSKLEGTALPDTYGVYKKHNYDEAPASEFSQRLRNDPRPEQDSDIYRDALDNMTEDRITKHGDVYYKKPKEFYEDKKALRQKSDIDSHVKGRDAPYNIIKPEKIDEFVDDMIMNRDHQTLAEWKIKHMSQPSGARLDDANIAGYSRENAIKWSKLKQRLAAIPGLWEDQSISHISVPSEIPRPMWNREKIKRHYDASGPLKTKFITGAGKREAIGADKTIDDYFDKNPQGEKLTKQYKKLEGIGNKGLRKIPARRVVHNPFEGPSHGFDELSGLTDEGLPYRTRPSERFTPDPKEGSIEELESRIGIEPKLSFDESLKRYPRPKNVMYRSVAEKHAKLKQRLSRLEE